MVTATTATTLQPAGCRSTLDWALAYASLGLRVVPIAPGRKHPALKAWQDAATDDPDTVRNWWTGLYANHGVGIALGPQPNGLNLFAVDGDGARGLSALERLDAEHGIPATWEAITGSGGSHVILNAPADVDVRNQQAAGSRIAPGVDVRGAGGQILVAPTVHPDGGTYEWVDGRNPWDADIADAPVWLIDLVAPPKPEPQPEVKAQPRVEGPATTRPAPSYDDESPADWLRRSWDWSTELQRAGWSLAATKGNGDTWWTRPGKAAKDGHSAVLHHPDGPFVIFTTEIPQSLAALGKTTADGSGRSVSPLDWVAAHHHSGSLSDATRALRSEMRSEEPPRTPTAHTGPPVRSGEPPAGVNPATGEIARATNLPDEFWEARPELAHVRAAAHARLVSADATLIAVLARALTLVPACYALPPIIGGHVSLNLFGSILDPSGGGKSAAMSVARQLVPIRHKHIVDPILPSSGEGLIEAFMGWVDDEDPDTGKKRKERRQIHTAGFAWVDEGQGLLAQADRSGTTIMETIRSAWMGGDLGQHNASEDRRRWLGEHRYRLCMVVGFQLAYAAQLIADGEGGTPQRFTFALGTDPTVDPSRGWPGPLEIESHPAIPGSLLDVEFHPEITAGIRQRRLDRSRGALVVDPLDTHEDLRIEKVAAGLSVLAGRLDVNPDDWELAGVVDNNSKAVRSLALDRARHASQAMAETAARRSVEHDERVELAKVRRATESAARSIARQVWRDGPMTLAAAWRNVTSRHRNIADRHDALMVAVDRGWVGNGDILNRGEADPT